MNVSAIMTRGLITIDRDASVAEAVKKMMDRRVTSIIIEKDDENDSNGIITRKDIVNEVIAHRIDPKDAKVSDIMSEPLLTITPDMDIVHVSRLMAKTNIRRFPVIADGKLIGLVSNSDIIRAATIECL